jgi:hypothetical protein
LTHEFPGRAKNIISGNTFEDETHSRLFVEDWKKLRLDEHLGWTAGDTIWWLFLARDTEPFRRFGMRFSRMSVVDEGDPLVRFAHSEAGEACGHVFFSNVVPVASALQAETGLEYRYFGVHHLDREPGHVLDSPGIFEHQILDEHQRRMARVLANEMFDIFFEMHDCFLHYAKTYAETGAHPQRMRDVKYPLAQVAASPPPSHRSQYLSPEQAELRRLLDERKRHTAAHPFYSWLQWEDSISPREKLQRFVPMWVMDIMGYRDLNRYALRYAQPGDERERAINAWVEMLETHSALFMNDWDQLGMDALLGWQARQTLKFLFLDPRTDVHRRNIASFIKLAFAHAQPVRRFWLLEALESSGLAFFANTRIIASQVERQSGIRLDYLGDRHDLAHPSLLDSRSAAMQYAAGAMTPEDRDVAAGMIETVFDAVDEQLSISLEVATSNRLAIPRGSDEREEGRARAGIGMSSSAQPG